MARIMKKRKLPPRKKEVTRRPSYAGPKAKCASCGDIIQSMNRRDYKKCSCNKIGIDGGSAYTRCTGAIGDFIWLNENDEPDNG